MIAILIQIKLTLMTADLWILLAAVAIIIKRT